MSRLSAALPSRQKGSIPAAASAALAAAPFLIRGLIDRSDSGKEPTAAVTPTPETTAEPTPTPEPTPLQFTTVDASYFDDALFIGDSRTVGIAEYGNLKNATYFADVGLNVYVAPTKAVAVKNVGTVTLPQLLSQKTFGKVYIMLGMNELGWVYESVFKEDYGKIIDKIREINPDATIYIQSIMPVSKWKDSTDDVYTIANVERLNAQLRDLADEKEVWYVDVAAGVMDEDGYLPYEATGDGVHLTPEYCVKWMDYLRTHTAQ